MTNLRGIASILALGLLVPLTYLAPISVGASDPENDSAVAFPVTSIQGDSGGPVFVVDGAAGIVVSAPTINGVHSTRYSTIPWVRTQTGYRPCYASSYPC